MDEVDRILNKVEEWRRDCTHPNSWLYWSFNDLICQFCGIVVESDETANEDQKSMKRVWVVKYFDTATDLMNIDRIFNNEEAATDYMTEAATWNRTVKLESWKVYSTWPEKWPEV